MCKYKGRVTDAPRHAYGPGEPGNVLGRVQRGHFRLWPLKAGYLCGS